MEFNPLPMEMQPAPITVFPITLIVLLAVGFALVALSKHFGIGRVLAVGGVGLVVFALFFLKLNSDSQDAAYHSANVARNEALVARDRKAPDQPEPMVSAVDEDEPTIGHSPAEDPGHAPVDDDKPADDDTTDSSEPEWMSIAGLTSAGDSPAVVSDGPRPTLAECEEHVSREVRQHMTYYARTYRLNALARRPDLLTEEVLDEVVSDEYVSTSPHMFNGRQQEWYTLHKLLKYDRVQEQLTALNDRAVADERLVMLGVGAAGILGLLGLAFVVLKATESPQAKPVVAEQSTEWKLGIRSTEEAKSKLPVTLTVAVGVVVIILGAMLTITPHQEDLPDSKPKSRTVETDENFAPDKP